mgnify:CR=1 FL=1
MFCLFLFVPLALYSQQVADTTYNPEISNPAYEQSKGPLLFIDEGHFNFHTKTGRFLPFAKLLEIDGYNVRSYEELFEKEKLSKGKILVISNALNKINVDDWFLPTPSAFTAKEIEAVKEWVSEGGSLFLIADHMPMAGAAKDLAAVFGCEFTNGFALDTSARGPSLFSKKDKTLTENIITKGRNETEKVEQVATFTGQAFKISEPVKPILIFNSKHINFLPDTAWVFNDKTIKYNLEGFLQGAYTEYGKGRVVLFGKAAMFTAQLAGPDKYKVGMNSSIAPKNFQLLLNIIHWLDGIY